MTDKELTARLRLPWPKDGSGDEVTLPIWVLILTAEAADRIEALTKERDSLLAGHRALNIGGARLQDRAEAAEAKLTKAVEAWIKVNQHEGVIVECHGDDAANTWNALCATLAEIKGETK